MNDQYTPDNTARECRSILDQNRACPLADTLVSFREDELAPGDAAAVAAHLGSCQECARLIERLEEAEDPMPMAEDTASRAAREEDCHEVAKALGFRVGRPSGKPLLERLSWIWETRVPAMVPAAACAILLAVMYWPARPESPVTLLGPVIEIYSIEQQTRGASDDSREADARVNDRVMVCHTFMNSSIEEGTMVNVEITGPQGTEQYDPVSVVLVGMEDNEAIKLPCIQLPLTFNSPGSYQLRLSHPGNAFSPATLTIRIHPN